MTEVKKGQDKSIKVKLQKYYFLPGVNFHTSGVNNHFNCGLKKKICNPACKDTFYNKYIGIIPISKKGKKYCASPERTFVSLLRYRLL